MSVHITGGSRDTVGCSPPLSHRPTAVTEASTGPSPSRASSHGGGVEGRALTSHLSPASSSASVSGRGRRGAATRWCEGSRRVGATASPTTRDTSSRTASRKAHPSEAATGRVRL